MGLTAGLGTWRCTPQEIAFVCLSNLTSSHQTYCKSAWVQDLYSEADLDGPASAPSYSTSDASTSRCVLEADVV
jgi:hypothetical protein